MRDSEQELEDYISGIKLENLRLSAIIYSILKHHGENYNLVLKDAATDKLPDKVLIGYNIVGDDAIITAVFGSALKRIEIQRGEEDVS